MPFDPLKRREFITLLGGAAAVVAARGTRAAVGDADDWVSAPDERYSKQKDRAGAQAAVEKAAGLS
jgi:hypothetical protein